MEDYLILSVPILISAGVGLAVARCAFRRIIRSSKVPRIAKALAVFGGVLFASWGLVIFAYEGANDGTMLLYELLGNIGTDLAAQVVNEVFAGVGIGFFLCVSAIVGALLGSILGYGLGSIVFRRPQT